MQIHGFQTLTLLDYPGRVACTLFLGGCNFHCPFCQNSGLVLSPGKEPVVPMEEVRKTLQKRKKVLDGVCITGGEPTLAPDLPELIREIKEMGYLVGCEIPTVTGRKCWAACWRKGFWIM